MRRTLASGVLALVAAGVFPASARWRDFAPVPFENHLYLDLYGFYERDALGYGEVEARWNDTFFREKLTLSSGGYFYHPRFLQYQVSFAGALKQERYDASLVGDLGWRRGSGLEYDARLLLLPEHPYNLELFALRYEPLLREQLAVRRNGMQRSYGGSFRYRRKPWFAHARLNDDAVESGTTETRATRLNAGGQYLRDFRGTGQLSLSANVNPSRFDTSQGLTGTSDQNVLSGSVEARRVRLTANVSHNTIDQDSPLSGAFRSDDRASQALLAADLPLRFRTDASYRVQRSENASRLPSDTAERELTDRLSEFRFNLTHRLYESLDTNYMFLRDDRTSSGGESGSVSNSLNLSYSKEIVGGRLLAGLSLTRADTDTRGEALAVNEPHAGVTVPGRFTLDRANVETTSIEVYLIDFRPPLPPQVLVRLVENTHYVVSEVGDRVEIDVSALPPEFMGPGPFAFEVTYALKPGRFELRSDTAGYNLSVELFDQRLTPYYGYSAVRSEVLSGTFTGIPVDSTSHTLGLLFREGRFRGLTEYQKLDWAVSPYRAVRGELQYAAPLHTSANLVATASLLNKRFPEGSSIYDDTPYTDQVFSANCNFQKQLASRNLSVSAGGSYSRMRGRVGSDSYSVNSSVVWKIGRLDLTAGLSAYAASSTAGEIATTRRDHGVVYFKVRRGFF